MAVSSDDLFSATREAGDIVRSSYQLDHANGTRTDTRAFLTNLFRTRFTTYHVTEVDASNISLFDFAAAGKATLIFDATEDSQELSRVWHPDGKGAKRKSNAGELRDVHRYARFQYIYEGNEFQVYYMKYEDTGKPDTRVFFILYPCAEDNANVRLGHCDESEALIRAVGKWTSQPHQEIFVFDNGHWRKSKDLYNSVKTSSWDDVILDPHMKQALIDDVQGFFDNRATYEEFRVPWKRGIILHGVPGNGKTVSIKALMSTLHQRPEDICCLYIKSLSSSNSTSHSSVRQIFTRARNMAPCLLVFEDLDSLVTDDIRSYFLNEVDGLEPNDGILMIGSTNYLEKLDPAIAKRPSRFDRKYHFRLPGVAERTLYAEYWRGKLLENGTIDFPKELCPIIARLTEGFSFAYLKELFVMSLLALVRGVKGDDFEIVDTVDAEDPASKGLPPATQPSISAYAGKPASSPTTSPLSAPTQTTAAQTCICKRTCPDCALSIPSPSPSADTARPKKQRGSILALAEDPARKIKLAMPRVDIPEQLVDNTMLKVVKNQIRVLHYDMDNTTEDKWLSGKREMTSKGTRVF